VEEEIHVRANHDDRIVALLNDDSNSVGSVHLGVVHYWTLDSCSVEKREQMITKMSFADTQELQTNREAMETWSQLCLDHLDEMAQHANFKNSN
jgi:predicted NUDIX family phosphoesterase